MRPTALPSRLHHAAARRDDVRPAVRVLRHAIVKEEQEAAKNTFTCLSAGDRIVIRFDVGEARLLMPDGDRVSLYQIPAASGVRYANGDMELRGKGTELQLVRHGAAIPLSECQPYQAPK